MPSIIIMNNATEQMLGRNLNASQAMFAAKAAMRNVWLAYPGDVIVSLARLDPEFEAYLSHALGTVAGEVSIVRPDVAEGVVLGDAYLRDAGLFERLKAAIGDAPDWCLDPCYHTRGVALLRQALGLPKGPGHRLALEHGTDLFNRKSHFRQLAAASGLPLPEGAIALSASDFAEMVTRLLPVTAKVIVKLDNGAGGTGNFVLSAEQCGPQAGACETLVLDRGDPEGLSKIWSRLQSAASGPVVVEAYHPATQMFYLEYLIAPDGAAQFVNSGTIRLRAHDDPAAPDLFWVGLELPAQLPSGMLAKACAEAELLLATVAALGYRGPINIDAIVTLDGHLLFNECNGRWGGGTVLHEIGKRLIGAEFAASHVVASLRDLPSPGFAPLLALLENAGLLFDPAKGHGSCVLACDDDMSHSFEAVVIANSPKAARQLEAQLVAALGAAR